METTETKEQPKTGAEGFATDPAKAAPSQEASPPEGKVAETKAEAKQQATENVAELKAELDRLKKLEPDAKEVTALRQKLASAEGRLKNAVTREDFEDLSRQTTATLRALVEGLKAGGNGADEVGKVVDGIERTAAQRKDAASYQSLLRQAEEAAQERDEDGNPNGKPVFDIRTAPEVKEEREEWDEAAKAKDWAAMASIVGRISAKAGRVQRKRDADALKSERKKREDAEKARDDAEKQTKAIRDDANAMDAGNGAPVASESLEALAKKDTRRMTPKELAEHDRKITAAMRQR